MHICGAIHIGWHSLAADFVPLLIADIFFREFLSSVWSSLAKAVTVDVAVAQNRDKVEQFRITAKMVGVFKKEGESDIKSDEDFGRINGAAIVFPFVREHIANMALKGGLGTVLIPPVNFTKYTGKE